MAIPGIPFKLDARDMGVGDPVGSMTQGQSFISNLIAQQLNQARTKRENAMANLPFGGANVPGQAGQIIGLEMVKQKYGENSPQYNMALKAFDLSQTGKQSQINYQNVLTNTLPVRSLTPTGKAIVEGGNVAQGNSPTGQSWGVTNPGQVNTAPTTNPGEKPGSAPANQKKLGGVYNLLLQQGSTDADARKKNLYATNIEKTLAAINPDDLTHYAGAWGGLRKFGNELLSPFGKESKEYDDFANALNKSEFLSKQVRQFYGDSIKPEMLEKLQSLVNPATWRNNPALAKSIYNQTKSLLGQELKTYRDAMEDTQVYKGQDVVTPTSTQTSPAEKKVVSQGSKRLAKGLTLPKFNSKEEFNAWYKNQDTTVKEAVKLALKNGG
jgi:hypothetical protein